MTRVRYVWQRSRRWLVLTLCGVVVGTVAGGILHTAGYHLRLIPLILLATAGTLAIAVFIEGFGPAQPHKGGTESWALTHAVPYAPPGRDSGVIRAARQVSDELRHGPDEALHRRLRTAAQFALKSQHGINLADPGAADYLGADLQQLLTGRARRLRERDISRIIDRIEAL